MKIMSLMLFMLVACSKQSTPAKNPEPDKTVGQPCAQEIALVCPEGQIDACLKTPPEGDKHQCVASALSDPPEQPADSQPTAEPVPTKP